MVIQFRTITRYFHQLIHFMQKRMRETCQTIDGKSEVIYQYWDKFFFVKFTKASALKDQAMK